MKYCVHSRRFFEVDIAPSPPQICNPLCCHKRVTGCKYNNNFKNKTFNKKNPQLFTVGEVHLQSIEKPKEEYFITLRLLSRHWGVLLERFEVESVVRLVLRFLLELPLLLEPVYLHADLPHLSSVHRLTFEGLR